MRDSERSNHGTYDRSPQMYMTERMYRQFITSRFGDAVSIDYDPLEDGAGQRTGTEVTIHIPRDARETFRQAQFLSIAELTGGYEWDLESDASEIRLVVSTRRSLPADFDDAEDPSQTGTAHDDYVASLEHQFAESSDPGELPTDPDDA